MSGSSRLAGLVLVAALAVGAAPPSVEAQGAVERLAQRCAAEAPELAGPCLETALAVEATRGIVGLAASGGPALPGGSSTLGKRYGGTPRVAVSVRAGLVDGSVPRPGRSPGDTDVLASSLHATAALGIFDGFSPAPTVGGLLSVDVLGTASTVFLPEDDGFDGGATGWGLGVRVGVLRESFTLPGVTLSAARRWMGDVELGSLEEDGTRAETGVTVTSLRATAGKDFLAFGLLGGVGWDRYGGEARVSVLPAGGGAPAEARSDDMSRDRVLFFGGLGYTFLVAEVSLEGGYASGFDGVEGRPGGGYDPESGSVWARIGLRVTF